jgi:hypothetical protein
VLALVLALVLVLVMVMVMVQQSTLPTCSLTVL